MLVFGQKGSMYESELITITPEIKTPVKAGQNQSGSARWLSKKAFGRHFANIALNEINPTIIQLMEKGEDDLNDKSVEPLIDITALPSAGVVLGMSKCMRLANKRLIETEKIYYVEDDLHTLCIGSTRSGKTRGVVLESIGLLGLAGESMVISDPKAELYNYTAVYLERLGYEVIALDFKNPLKSHRYNFLQPVIDSVNADDMAQAISHAWDIANTFVGESRGEKIWNDGEKSVIVSSILAVVCDNKKNPQFQNMTNVYTFISEMCKMDAKEPPISRYLASLPDSHPAKTLMGVADVAPARTKGSFYTSALSTLSLFTNPLIYDMTCQSDFKPQDCAKRKQALFIILPDEKLTYYKLASLFVVQQYQLLVTESDKTGGRLTRRVNFLLDEYGNFVQMPNFPNMISVGGGRRIRFNLFVQSLSQIVEKYGKEASETIKGNCQYWIYLRTDDQGTLDEISKKLGNYTVSTHSKSSSYGSHSSGTSSVSASLTGRALLMPDEVRMIARPYSLVTSETYPAMFIAPDLSKYMFNKMFGLGDVQHNLEARMMREENRHTRSKPKEIELWGIWNEYNQAPAMRRRAERDTNKAKPAEMD